MRFRNYFALVLLVSLQVTSAWGSPELDKGKEIYAQHCAECHGTSGEGVEDEFSKPLTGDWPIEKLSRYVDETMPDYDPDEVKGKDAELVSRFIYQSFYQKPQLFRKESKVQLARLTNRQYRQSVTDLFAQFEGQPVLSKPVYGLKGKYYNAEGMNKRKKMHAEQIDPLINFNYGEKAALDGMNPKKFSVYWEGSVLPRESGWYEFFVRSPNGFEFNINHSVGPPTIDEKVTAGVLREESAKLYLLGGRPYPIRLNYYKFDDPNASIELSWKTPVGEKEIIPTEYLFTQVVPPSYISQQKLPPDDASHGYERGIQVDSTWDESITYAALEAAKFAGIRMLRLAKTNEKDEKRKEKIITFAKEFVRYAFREKLSTDEINHYINSKFAEDVPLHISIEKIVLLTLKSPRFLYPEWQSLAKKNKDPFVVASRMALYFWDSIPDKRIHSLIDRDNLSKEWQIHGLAKVMLKDGRTRAKFTDFMIDWLDMKNKELPTISRKQYPDFNSALALDLRRSLLSWIEKSIWEETISWKEFIQMDKVQINERIAKFYDIAFPDDDNVTGFWETNASVLDRTGLFTHPYILASHSYAEESSPIHRGVFTARKILGRTLRPPTEAVSFRNADFNPNWTMREKVTELTKAANCMSCHDQINSSGFVLESFDAAGKFRTHIHGKPIDLKVHYLDSKGENQVFTNANDLLRYALRSSQSAKSFINELFKHLAKQSALSYSNLDIETLSNMLNEGQLSIQDLYLKLCFKGASDGFAFAK